MSVTTEGATITHISHTEYQGLLLCCAGLMSMALAVTEVVLNRFQVLPVLFPGMFCVQDRHFYCFSFDISDGALGKTIRAEAKMLIRVTLCVVLAYIWQNIALETTQFVGTEFPKSMCEQERDCFASEFDFYTMISRQHQAIDCNGPHQDFEKRVVVSCIRFVQPAATLWLKHLAIAHSVTQLSFKCFEVLVWITGNSVRIRCAIGALTVATVFLLLLLLVGSQMVQVVSWFSFVLALSIPIFLSTVWKSGKSLELLWKEESAHAQTAIEQHLNVALSEFEAEAQDGVGPTDSMVVAIGDNTEPVATTPIRHLAHLLSSGTELLRGTKKNFYSILPFDRSPSASSQPEKTFPSCFGQANAKGNVAWVDL